MLCNVNTVVSQTLKRHAIGRGERFLLARMAGRRAQLTLARLIALAIFL